MNAILYRYPRDSLGVRTGADGTSSVGGENWSCPLRGGPPEEHVVQRIDGQGGDFILRRPNRDDRLRGRVREPGYGPPLADCDVVPA